MSDGQRCPSCEAELHVADDCFDCLIIQESKRMASRFKAQDSCRRGHAYTPENTIIEVYKGKKNNRCRTCLSARRRAAYASRSTA